MQSKSNTAAYSKVNENSSANDRPARHIGFAEGNAFSRSEKRSRRLGRKDLCLVYCNRILDDHINSWDQLRLAFPNRQNETQEQRACSGPAG